MSYFFAEFVDSYFLATCDPSTQHVNHPKTTQQETLANLLTSKG